MLYQPIFDIAEICHRKGVDQVVLCPGSRCAPLTLAFARHKGIKCRTFSDERSAGFIGLGLAQSSATPVALICTSGSAAYNFAPAVAEAFFSQTPLIIFTADRPAEWIGQHDGQTIYQSGIFGRHVKHAYQLPQDYEHHDSKWAINRIVNEAINLSQQHPKGPVHINAPFREPLYPDPNEKTTYSEDVRIIELHSDNRHFSESQKIYINENWTHYPRILIVAAQQDYNIDLLKVLHDIKTHHQLPVVVDIISNFNELDIIKHSDLFLGQASDEIKKMLQPDLLITFGKSLISKNLKNFLRKYGPKNHWHIQPAGTVADTFKNVTDVFYCSPLEFLTALTHIASKEKFELQKQVNYTKLWEIEERRASRALNEFFPLEDLTEMEIVREVLTHIPPNSNLHLANSMSVRYANLIGIDSGKKNIRVFANRGTSGIDGCTSTAVGHALGNENLNVLITGDMAFFYDRNAFWHNYPVRNLRILLLNNHGGLIFNMIDGPASQPEAAEYFITQQKLNASKLCEEFGFDHLKLDSKRKIRNYIKDFFEPGERAKVLEVETDIQINRTTSDKLKKLIKESYES